MTPINDLWKQLDDLGEEEVRKRLAQNVYGQKKLKAVQEWLRRRAEISETKVTIEDNAHRQQTIEIARSSRNATWASAIASIIAVLLSIVALYFSYTAFHRSVKDILILSVDRYYGDYKTRLLKFGSSDMPALLNSYWSCLLVSRGDKALSVIDMDVEQLDEKGVIKYSGIKGNIFDKDMKPVTLPFDIEPGKSAKIYMEVRLAVSPAAFWLFKDKYGFDQTFLIEDLIRFLAAQKMDFYGNPVTPIMLDGKYAGYKVKPPQKDQFLNFVVKTGAGQKFLAQAGWYIFRKE
jgi:hypothetical protein